jgi:predicted nucleic acid-binding protein
VSNPKVLFDTNFYTDLTSKYPEVIDTFVGLAKENADFIMPTIVEHELLSYSNYDLDIITKAQFDDYIKLSEGDNNIVELAREIAKKASEIRRYYRINHNKCIKAPDSIIAATAILTGATLYSNNDKDFKIAQNELGLNYKNPITDQHDLQEHRSRIRNRLSDR